MLSGKISGNHTLAGQLCRALFGACVITVLCSLAPAVSSAAQVTLAWDANTEPDLAGYKLYYGISSGSYQLSVDVGNRTSYTLLGLLEGQFYYLAAKAYDSSLNESGFSNEVSTTAAASTASGPVGYWKFDEGSGTTAADSSGNGLTGTLANSPTWTAGHVNGALAFNGSSSYVEALDADTLSPGAEATFSALVFLNSAPTELTSVFNKWSQTVDDEYLLGINPNQTLFFTWQTTGGGAYGTPSFNAANGTGQVPLNTWTHIALVRSGATLSFYLNGVLDASVTAADANPFRNGITSLRIGGQSRGGVNRFFNGSLDEARLYNRALGASEVFDLFTGATSTGDTTPPTVSLTAPTSGSTVSGTLTVSATASDNVGVAGVQFKLDGVNLGAEDTTNAYSISWNTTLASNGSHSLTAVARDAAGNSTTSAAISVTVANDTTPPVISSVSAFNISTFAATITWATNEASDSQVEYGPTTAYGSSTPLNSSLLTAHSITLTGLLANTQYHYRVKSRDAAGNLSTSADFTFTTLADITPPSVPSNLSASAVSSSQITLSWTASTDNVGVAGYTIYRGAVQIATTSLTSYSDTSLSPSTAYTYAVAAYDAAGNVSAQSAPASAVTLPLPPPSLGLVAAYGLNEGSGSVTVDTSNNSNTGTLNGAAWTTAGKFGNALAFNGTSSYVKAADIDALTPGTGATFEAWVFLNSAPTEIASVFNKWSQTADDEYLLGINPNQTLYFAWQTTGGYTWGTTSFNGASGTGQVPLNTWAHIAVVRSGVTLSFYINGNLDASVNAMDTNAFRNGINALHMGGQGRSGMNRFLNGSLDEARIYNRALSQAEIQDRMNMPIGDPPPDTMPPTVSLTAPSNGATVSGSAVTVSATASDNVWVASLQFKLDGANLGVELTTVPYTLSWNTATAPNGTHTLTAVARDAAGNTATSSSVTVTISNDTTAPVISAASVSSITPSGATITWVTDEASDSQVEYGPTSAYGQVTALASALVSSHSVGLSGLSASTVYHYRVKSKDAMGNLAVSGDFTFTTLAPPDTTVPIVSLTAPVAGATVAGTVSLTASATDNVGVVGVQFKLDGANLGAEVTAALYTLSWTTTTASNGAHSLTAVARDAAGNTTPSAAVSVTVDNAVPVISAVSSSGVGSSSATITWTTNEAADSQVEYGFTSAYGQVTALASALVSSHSVGLSGLSASTVYHYRVKSKDAVGNLAVSGDFTFTTLAPPDTTVPTVSLTAPAASATVSGTVTVSASATDNVGVVGVQFKLDGVNLGTELTVAPYVVSWNTASASNGAHSLTAVARDAAGNTATATAVSVTVDNAVPVISAVSSSGVGSSSATITWTTDEVADSQVEYGPTSAYGQVSALASPLVSSHSVALSGLSASTLYHYRVKSKDAMGNLAVSGDFTFTTLAPPDTTVPIVSLTAPVAGATVAGTVSLTASATDNVGVVGVQFKLDGANLGAEVTAAPYGLAWITTTASNGTHSLTAVARDAAGNLTTAAAVTVTVDNAAPLLSSVTSTSISSSAATITWTTNEASDTQVEYGLTSAYGQVSALASQLVSNHNLGLSGLSASTLYHYRVKSRDAAGNLATSADFTFTTAPLPDTTPPAVSMTAPTSGATIAGTVSVSAIASDNVGVVGVQFKLDGANLGAEVTAAPYGLAWITTTASNGTHSLTAVARDAAGNLTLAAVTVTVDNAAPVISAVSSSGVGSSAASIAWTTDEAADSQVEYGLTSAYGQVSALASLLVNSHSVALSGLSASTVYHYRVKSRDAVGNLATSGDFTFTTAPLGDTTPPTVSIVLPAVGATVSGTVTVLASAADNVGVVGVQFKLDGVNLGTEDTVAPYSVSWNTSLATKGTHTLTAVARDAAGNTTTSSSVTVTVTLLVF